jgi:hypothetical protein
LAVPWIRQDREVFRRWFLFLMSDEAVVTGVPEGTGDSWTGDSPGMEKRETNTKRILKERRK